MNWDGIHPKARPHFQRLEMELVRRRLAGETPSALVPFEGYRGPRQQAAMRLANLKADHAWESPHNYGMALRFGVYDGKTWTFDAMHDWKTLSECAHQSGLTMIGRDTVVHGLWNYVRRYLV